MRQTRTFLAGDIEGSTRRWLDDESAMSAALTQHDEAVTEVVSSAGGDVFKHTGDGFFAAFADPETAVASAIRIQQQVDLPIRMAIATGPAESRDGDWYGGILSRTARLMDSGSAGQVLLGDVTASLVRDHLDLGVELVAMGRHRFRDLHEPYEVFQLVAPDLETEFPPIKSLESFPNNLPVQMTSFIGRDAETDAGLERMEAGRLVTLTGVGGVGKTRLALAIAAAGLDSFPGGVWFVELAALADPGLVATQTMSAMGAVADGRDPTEIVIGRCAEPTLLLLDNCEHLIDDVAKFAENVLRGAPEAKVLATSREGLGLMGESVYRVPSLRGDSGLDDAVELFASRSRQVSSDFVVDDANRAAVEQICRRLDGIPLAIELATARLRVLDAAGIAGRLDDRFRLLTGGARTALPRQRTLAATMDWSYDLLSEKEQTMLRRTAVFAGSYSLEAAEAVCTDGSIDVFEVLDLVERLVSASLVTPVGPGRFRMLETVRQYAVDKLAESGEVSLWRDRHAEHFEAVASTINADLLSPQANELLMQLQADQDNLRLAITHALESGDAERAGWIVEGCHRFWQTISAEREAYDWTRSVIDRAEDRELKGLLAGQLSLLAKNLNRPRDEWLRWTELYGELLVEPPSDPLKRVQWHHHKGLDLDELERWPEAYEAFMSTAELAREIFPTYVVASWMAVITGVRVADPPGFRELIEGVEESLATEKVDHNIETALGLLNVAWEAEGDPIRARAAHERHREALPEGYVSMMTPAFWVAETRLAGQEGDLDAARKALAELVATAEAEAAIWPIIARSVEARVEVLAGDSVAAVQAMRRALELVVTHDLLSVVPAAIMVLEAAGDNETAWALLEAMDDFNDRRGLRDHPWDAEDLGELRQRLRGRHGAGPALSVEADDRSTTKAALMAAFERIDT